MARYEPLTYLKGIAEPWCGGIGHGEVGQSDEQ